MPELPEMRALAERLDAAVADRVLARCDSIGFSGLQTVTPPPAALTGRIISGIGQRGKYVVVSLQEGARIVFHLGQGGRVDIERPPKSTHPRGSMLRLVVEGPSPSGPSGGDTPADDRRIGIFVHEHGTRRLARWWILAPGDDGPLATLGPEADHDEFTHLVCHGDSTRRLHTWLRDQHVVAGLGRGYTDDVLHQARLSPFATLAGLSDDARRQLVDAVHRVMEGALASERRRSGGLAEARLGDRFAVHRRWGQPCPRCGDQLLRVSYDAYEITYCAACQTGGRVLADRRLSRLLR